MEYKEVKYKVRPRLKPRQSENRAHIPNNYSVLSYVVRKDNYRDFCSNNLVIYVTIDMRSEPNQKFYNICYLLCRHKIS